MKVNSLGKESSSDDFDDMMSRAVSVDGLVVIVMWDFVIPLCTVYKL